MTVVPCAGCGAGCGPHHQKGFDAAASSTAAAPACGTPGCACGATACGCSVEAGREVCTFSREYAEASTAAGAVVSDVVRVAGWASAATLDEATGAGAGAGAAPPPLPRLTFGCATKETGEIKAQRAAGILGLGDAGTGFAHQLARGGGASFGLCLGGGPRGGGALVLGRDLPPAAAAAVTGPTVTVPLEASPGHPHHYAVALESVSFGGAPPAVPPSALAAAPPAVLDSGTTFTYLPPAAFDAAARVVAAAAEGAGLANVPAARGYGDVCFSRLPTDAAVAAAFPNMTLTFAGGESLELPPESYLFRHADAANAACVGLFAAPAGKGALIGAITMRGMLVTFDAGARRVGMAAADCGAVGDAARERRPAAATSAAAPPAPPPSRSRLIIGLALAAPAAALAAAALAAAARRRKCVAAVDPPGAPPSPGSNKFMHRLMSADGEAAAEVELGRREGER